MREFTLEIYFETDDDYALAESASSDLRRLVGELAPHISLHVLVLKAKSGR